MISHFNRDDQWRNYRRRNWQIERYSGEYPMQRLHVDVTFRRKDEILRVDEKIIRGRRDGLPAAKANLETMSCSTPGVEKFGWISRLSVTERDIRDGRLIDLATGKPTDRRMTTMRGTDKLKGC
jgi:hypothetical protein